ncbi:stage VI sporulation protein D [Cytobacillus horneckiae]|uniref:LysM peptidoglycan-binding domain-containing protein n=1 Tax=Cytobacillus horneckiae TaxID=549687 RepID=UPI0019D1CA81|nr:LysM peptidoglycan-binding domain-containing protein [Cytobacillus horneckiae]MBN6887885.1 LysM peptidoglycan-binding domain-containing protein [Cytobacillus horneckiae]
MSQGNPSCLRFSLEESVWFQKGQEVSQLISISLDPNITIQESEQYVTIQGALELTGEYHRDASSVNESDNGSVSTLRFIQTVEERDEGVCEFTHYFPVDITIPNNRIESINDIDVEVESFDYVFPERSCMKLNANLTITGLYGDQQHVAVQEEENNVLEFESAPRFNGVEEPNDELQETEEEKTEISFSLAPEEDGSEEFEPFAAEARKQPEKIKEEPILNQSHFQEEEPKSLEPFIVEERKQPEKIKEEPVLNQLNFQEEEPKSLEPFIVEERKQPEKVKEEPVLNQLNFQEEEPKSLEPFVVEARKQSEKIKEEPFLNQSHSKEEPKNFKPLSAEGKEEPEIVKEEPVLSRSLPDEEFEESPAQMPEVSFMSQRYEEKKLEAKEIFEVKPVEEESFVEEVKSVHEEEAVLVESSSHEEEKQVKKKKSKKGMSLTEFFARKEEEVEVTKLKVCIVQQDDTIDIIAERYDISPQTLLRVNNLEINQDVYEGQALYIPATVTSY